MTTLPATIPGLVRRGSPVRALQAADMGLILPPWDYWPTANEPLVIVNYGDWGYRFADRDGESRHAGAWWFVLDITDPTGFHHALLWLAEKLGMDARYGLLWCHVPRQDFDHGQYTPAYWLLAGATPDSDGVTLLSWRWAFTEESNTDPRCAEYFFGKDASLPPDGYTTVPNILSAGDTEALRLAVLAVVGVEG